jgi:hypothetical protein
MITGLSQKFDDEALTFAAEVLTEMSGFEETYRYPTSSSLTIDGNLYDAMPGEVMLGDDTGNSEENEFKADKKIMFKTTNGKFFYVFTRGNEIWLDVSRLERGDQGAAMYHAIATYSFNTRKVFIGDPAGLSPDAIVRRTTAMLSSTLRFGSCRHFQPASEQLSGLSAQGILPLAWTYNDYDNLKSLIRNFYENIYAEHPEILDSCRFEFGRNQFIDQYGAPIPLGYQQHTGWNITKANRLSRAGQDSARRGIFIQSLMASKSEERPQLLEYLLRGAAQYVSSNALRAIF